MVEKVYVCFDFYCPNCKRRHIAKTDPDYICNPNINFFECSCNKKISVTSLIYLYKIKAENNDKNYVEIIK